MVGLVHKILFDFLEETAGTEVVLEVKRRAGVEKDKAFRMDEVYDDAEWRRIFAATLDVLNLTQEQAEEAYADFFLKDGQTRWPMWFKMASNAREFLLRQPKIHNGFATSQQDAAVRSAIDDKFKVEERDGELVVHYRSPNQLCGLYMALARWIINHYGDNAVVEEACCAKNGALECEIHVPEYQRCSAG